MKDQIHAYRKTIKTNAGHEWVNHSEKEFIRLEAHNNTVELFNEIQDRAKQGVFYYLSKNHLHRQLNEILFRWNHPTPGIEVDM